MVSSFFDGTSVHSVEGILAFSAFESGEHVFMAKEHSVIYVDDFFFHTALLTQLGKVRISHMAREHLLVTH